MHGHGQNLLEDTTETLKDHFTAAGRGLGGKDKPHWKGDPRKINKNLIPIKSKDLFNSKSVPP